MNRFTSTIRNSAVPMTRTDNGALTPSTTGSAALNFFAHAGALRGHPEHAVALFRNAYDENRDLAGRLALWARDVRGGAGEREIFRIIVKFLNQKNPEMANRLLVRAPELGRWDDLLVTNDDAFLRRMLIVGLHDPNTRQLVAKWLPREKSARKDQARRVMRVLGLEPKQYRRLLSDTSNTVEQLMCSRKWTEIDLEKVPSLAQSRYRAAFERHLGQTYKKTVAKMASGEAKVNASALYPYDVVKQIYSGGGTASRDLANAQWNALPNWLSDAGTILPMVDTSGSMETRAGNTGLCVRDIAKSIGLYLANKQEGPFKNLALTFSNRPVWVHFDGTDFVSDWRRYPTYHENTNLQAAFDLILEHAQRNRVPAEDMPKFLLIMSDMQFDSCQGFGSRTNFEVAANKFHRAGYELPQIVFWNLTGRLDTQSPVTKHQTGATLVSGFSPAVAKAVLTMDAKGIDPYAAMLKTVMDSRYDY